MTFHPRSVVQFGLFITRISDSLVSGASLRQVLELVCLQLGGTAAAIRIDDRLASGKGPVLVAEVEAMAFVRSTGAEGDSPVARESARFVELLESSHHISATVASDVEGSRYTLWLFRELSSAGFDAEELSLIEVIVSQIRQGLELSQRLGASELERALYSNVMDRLAVGVVILDMSGRVIRCSAKASEALAARDGLQLQAGKLRAASAAEDREFQQAIKSAIRSAISGEPSRARGLALTKLSGQRNLGIIVQPVQGEQRGSAVPTVAVYLRDPEANADVESDLVRQLFDLTPAEAAVARRLTAGLTLEDTAQSLDISRNTARAHLRSIFSKSGITRQTELVRLVLNSAAVLGERPRQLA